MTNRTHTIAASLLALSLLTFAPARAATDATQTPPAVTQTTAATKVVKNFYAQLSDTMKQGDQLGFAGRYKKLSPAITTAFNLPLMTRISVGNVWAQATPDEQQELISAFSAFSISTYASRFVKYNGEEFDVIGEKPTTGGVIVETKLTPKGADPVALNYLMRQDEKGNYRIVDVFLNGTISELATRRAEFNAIVNRDGIAALVTTLGEKSKQMGPS